MADSRGFTLIEILVVVVIIGLVAIGAVLTLGSSRRDDALETESRRLEGVISYVREQAELATREYGLRVEGGRYEFLAFDPRRGLWRTVDEDDILRLRTLPPGVRLRLIVEGREVLLRPPREGDPLVPQVMLFSNGDVTPFEITIERDGAEEPALIASTDSGTIDLTLPGDEVRR
jgi:general secretion pathway protein H